MISKNEKYIPVNNLPQSTRRAFRKRKVTVIFFSRNFFPIEISQKFTAIICFAPSSLDIIAAILYTSTYVSSSI